MISARPLLASPTRSAYISLSHRSHSPLRARAFSSNAARRSDSDHRASSKLFEDAAREEAEEASAASRPSRLSMLEGQNENWTGDESIQDAVLRMLVDKYKPLRSGLIRTADEKLKQAPPLVSTPGASTSSGLPAGSSQPGSAAAVTEEQAPSTWQDMANKPLLPAIEGHQPWHTTFKIPSHATSNVRYGQMPPAPKVRSTPASALDDKAKRKEREVRRRTEQAGRLSRARESTLDYRLGIKGSVEMQRRPNPVTLKGWANLVEDRIEKARQEGLFRNVKGRGQPLASTTQDRNPFIGREEFLMNRIVQRQGAAPPWVEIQGELESSIASFRELVKQSWTRRAIRMLTVTQPAVLLSSLTLGDVTSLRDKDWEARERLFHDHALEEVNALVRKYNGLAPYAVRRAYYMREAELERVYRESAQDILQGLAERVSDVGKRDMNGVAVDELDNTASGSTAGNSSMSWTFRDMVRDLWASFRGRA